MSRYSAMFGTLENRIALGAFLMLGDPDLETSAAHLDALAAGGADMIEVGIPFSDPVADGPVIQQAGLRALKSGVSVGDCLDLIAAFRRRHGDIPVGILTYANLVTARKGFMKDARQSGADSLLIADVPALEAEPFVGAMEAAGLEPVLIAAANTKDRHLETIARLSKAYTYCVTRSGITGTHAKAQFDPALLERLRSLGAPPPVFGFGISSANDVKAAAAAGASGVISGSAIVDTAAHGGDVEAFVACLKSGTGNESAAQ